MRRALDFIHAHVDELERRFRRPEKLLELLVEDYQKKLSRARPSCALLVNDSKRIESAARDHERAAGNAKAAAMQAIGEGRETEARLALLRKIEHEHARERLLGELSMLKRESDRMAGELAKLTDILEEARRKQHRLLARRDLAQALPTDGSTPAAGDAERSQEPDAMTDLPDLGVAVDDEIERAFQRLEREEKLRDEMQALRDEQAQATATGPEDV